MFRVEQIFFCKMANYASLNSFLDKFQLLKSKSVLFDKMKQILAKGPTAEKLSPKWRPNDKGDTMNWDPFVYIQHLSVSMPVYYLVLC